MLHGAANDVLENVDTSISARADRAMVRRGKFQQFLNVVVLTVVAIVGLPLQRAIWRRSAQRIERGSQ